MIIGYQQMHPDVIKACCDSACAAGGLETVPYGDAGLPSMSQRAFAAFGRGESHIVIVARNTASPAASVRTTSTGTS